MRSLGLEKPLFEPKEKSRKKAPPPKRKKMEEEEEDVESPAPKIQRVEKAADQSPHEGLRRSSSNATKIDYASEQNFDSPQPTIRYKVSGNDGPMGRETGKRLHDP